MSDEQNAIEMVRMGYDEPTRNLNFRVGFYTFFGISDPVCEAIRAIGPYNNFEPENAVAALQRAEEAIGSKISVGREGSPCLYIEVDYPDKDDARKNAIMAAMREAKADEVDFEGREVRAWWD